MFCCWFSFFPRQMSLSANVATLSASLSWIVSRWPAKSAVTFLWSVRWAMRTASPFNRFSRTSRRSSSATFSTSVTKLFTISSTSSRFQTLASSHQRYREESTPKILAIGATVNSRQVMAASSLLCLVILFLLLLV